MNYLSDRHQELAQNQKSGFMGWFHNQSFDKKLTAIAISLSLGVGCGGFAYIGSSATKVEFCFIKEGIERCQDKNNRPFTMTRWHWQRWKESGRPTEAVEIGTIRPTNPYKPFWAAGCFLGFAIGGWMLRHLQETERHLSQYEAIAEQTALETVRAKANVEVMLITTDQSAVLQQAELMSKAEVEITELNMKGILFEAETAGMTEDEKKEYVEFVRSINNPFQAVASLPGQSMDDIANPGDKVEGEEQPVLNDAKTGFNPWEYSNPNKLPKEYRWIREFISNTSLILGSQGSGKSWFVRVLALLKKLKGYRVIVLDPNSNQREWMGIEFYGGYGEIEEMMSWYVEEIQQRYNNFRQSNLTEVQWREGLWKEGKALSIICEEYTTFSDFIEDEELQKKFVKSANTLSRKQEAPVTFVTHNLSKECLGNVPGLFDIFKRMQRVFLDATTDSETDQPISAGTGRVKGVDSDEVREVVTPKLLEKITDFRNEHQKLNDTRNQLLSYEQMEGIDPIKKTEPLNRGSETLSQGSSDGSSHNEQRFTPLKLSREQIMCLVQQLRGELNQTQIIERLWQVKKGGSAAWKQAYNEFKQLTENI